MWHLATWGVSSRGSSHLQRVTLDSGDDLNTLKLIPFLRIRAATFTRLGQFKSGDDREDSLHLKFDAHAGISTSRQFRVGPLPTLGPNTANLYCPVRKHLALQLGFSALVDEAVQESMLTTLGSLRSFRGEASPNTWALKVASPTARRYVRAQRRHQAMLTDDEEPA